MTHLDYACGKGFDVRELRRLGYNSTGYDPHYYPNPQLSGPADVVTLGYVLNVIECPSERDRTLVDAYSLARKALIVSAIVATDEGGTRYGDGRLTQWQTFEKYFGCREFREYAESVLGLRSRRLAHGILLFAKVGGWKPLILQYDHISLKETMLWLKGERLRLQQECELSEGAFLEQYSSKGKMYWRLRSRFSNLPGKHGPCKCLHLGVEGSDRYLWGIDQLHRLDRLLMVELRLMRCENLLRQHSE